MVAREGGEPWRLEARQRRYLAAVALGPALGDSRADDRPRWTTQDVLVRAAFSDATLSRARSGLNEVFVEHGLDPNDYFVGQRGEHGLRNARVDIDELVAAKDDDRAVDRLLSEWSIPTDAQLPPDMVQLVNTAAKRDLADLLVRASDRKSVPRRRPSVAVLSAGGAIVIAVVAAVLVLLLTGGSANQPNVTSRAGLIEYAGGTAMTHADYLSGGGTRGPDIPGHKPIKITCRVRGLKVQDHNPWWYRIASAPWYGRYYVSADAFYNRNGQREGPLAKTPFVDQSVRLCPGSRIG